MSELRLGDIIDDFCIKCRRLTNHAIVSILEGKAAKVRCRTCYNDHDYRHEQAPPSKKDLKKAELLKEVMGAGHPGAIDDGAGVSEPVEVAVATATESDPVDSPASPAAATPATKKTRGRTKRA